MNQGLEAAYELTILAMGTLSEEEALDVLERATKYYRQRLKDAGKPTAYTVIALYTENNQRWADSFKTMSPQEAEQAAHNEAPETIRIAGVIEGDHDCVDQDPVLGYRP